MNRAFILITLPAGACAALYAQGFGTLTKDNVTLHRKLPAIFQLKGTTLNVIATATSPAAKPLADQLVPLLETALQHNDPRLVMDSKSAQTIITCSITSYTPPKIQQLTRQNTSFTKKGAQTTPQPYQKVTGAVTVAYKAREAKSGKTLDAAIIEAKVNEDYEQGGSKTKAVAETVNPKRLIGGLKHHESEEAIPASAEDVNQMLLKQLVAQITPRMVNADETIEVKLAKGKLGEAAKLGEAGLWPRMLEMTEEVPPFPKPEDEAYRLYNIGVAYEAMGYGAEDQKQALTFFEQASINYGKALDDKPSEKYFREPVNRIQEAMVIMKTLAERNGSNAAASAPVAGKVSNPVSPPSSGSRSTADSDTLTNDQIIELAKSGMDEANLIANIKDAQSVKFDLSVNGQKELLQNGVSNNVIAAMRQKASGTAPRRARTVPATSKAKTQNQ